MYATISSSSLPDSSQVWEAQEELSSKTLTGTLLCLNPASSKKEQAYLSIFSFLLPLKQKLLWHTVPSCTFSIVIPPLHEQVLSEKTAESQLRIFLIKERVPQLTQPAYGPITDQLLSAFSVSYFLGILVIYMTGLIPQWGVTHHINEEQGNLGFSPIPPLASNSSVSVINFIKHIRGNETASIKLTFLLFWVLIWAASVVRMFPGQAWVNNYSSQIGHQQRTKKIISLKSILISLIEVIGLWKTYRWLHHRRSVSLLSY